MKNSLTINWKFLTLFQCLFNYNDWNNYICRTMSWLKSATICGASPTSFLSCSSHLRIKQSLNPWNLLLLDWWFTFTTKNSWGFLKATKAHATLRVSLSFWIRFLFQISQGSDHWAVEIQLRSWFLDLVCKLIWNCESCVVPFLFFFLIISLD